MKFEIEIDDALVDALTKSLGEQLQDEAKRKQLAAFALKHVLEWMSGQAAYQSMTEQYTEWLTELLPIFFPDDVPTTERIFNNFSIPYGRAAYISRVLLEKQQTIWRQRGKANLLSSLKAKEFEAQTNNGKGEMLKYVPVSLDSISYRELTVILEDIFRTDTSLAPPVNKAVSPGRRTVDIPSQLFPKLIESLEA